MKPRKHKIHVAANRAHFHFIPTFSVPRKFKLTLQFVRMLFFQFHILSF